MFPASVNSTASAPASASPAARCREKKKSKAFLSIESGYHEHAGGLLLLAAANETALLAHLALALPTEVPTTRPPLTGSSEAVRQRLLLTLLFLGAVGLHRTWDLRGYTAAGLALLSGRRSAYGYRYTEAFLSQVAHFGGAECLTDALARWTTQVWHAPDETPEQPRSLTRLTLMGIASPSTPMPSFLGGWLDA